MRITFVARHDSGGGDDEGAITYALESLGHQVQRIRECNGRKAYRLKSDFCLSLKWDDITSLKSIHTPRIFWYFDLVDFPDPFLRDRNLTRIDWMQRTIPHIDLGFCTDGEWVNRDTTGKLVWLTQGFDSRVSPAILREEDRDRQDILFTGIRRGGKLRQRFVDYMTDRYQQRFVHHERGCYVRELAEAIAASKLVVCPEGPVAERYFSNRIYWATGLGGFVLHPRTPGVIKQYREDEEVIFYRNRNDLFDKVDHYLDDARRERRRVVAEAGRQRTLREHCYIHRVAEMIRIVKERLRI